MVEEKFEFGLDLTLSVTFDDDDLEEVLEEIKGDSQDWQVVIDSEYASMLEFGTMPSLNANAGPKSTHLFITPKGKLSLRTVSDAYYNIYKWARSIPGIKDPEAFAYTVYKSILDKGLKPHPFIRPALDVFEENINEIYQETGSFKGCMEILAAMIYDNLNGSGFASDAPKEFTGALKHSIRLEPVDEEYAENQPDDEVWDNPRARRDGSEAGPI